MPIAGRGWELHVTRLGLQSAGAKKRTYASYQAYQDGQPLADLSGFLCECVGPGENAVAGSRKRIEQGRYPLLTQFGRYKSIGYSTDTSTAGKPPMPALLLGETGNRVGILIHPGHPPNLYLSSIGCFNPTGPLSATDTMDFWDSRSRVTALIDDLRRFAPSAFANAEDTGIHEAWVVIDGEPMHMLPTPVGPEIATSLIASDLPPPPPGPLATALASPITMLTSSSLGTGADTNYVVNEAVIVAAGRQLGSNPLFWGRYFKGRNNPDDAQYKPARENSILRAHNIRVLPIARQTNHVVGDEQLGRTDAKHNAEALIEAFSLDHLQHRGSRTLVFLDVEPEHPVSAAYYFGWASALVASADPPIFAPALYGNKSSAGTWAGLSAAVARGAECHGLWIAHYAVSSGCVPTPAWSDREAVPVGIPHGCPVLAWQFAAECVGVDCNIINPAFQKVLMDGLVLPPDQLAPVIERLSVSLGDVTPASQAPFAEALKAAIEQLVLQGDSKALPDGKPYLFPDGIKSLELSVKIGADAGVTLTINGGQ
jgi:hypothetical protein